MPTYIVKEAWDVDFYVAWSTVVDNAVDAGDHAHFKNADPEVMARADLYGTSALWPEDGPPNERYLGWTEETVLVCNDDSGEEFLIHRGDIGRYARGEDVEHLPLEV